MRSGVVVRLGVCVLATLAQTACTAPLAKWVGDLEIVDKMNDETTKMTVTDEVLDGNLAILTASKAGYDFRLELLDYDLSSVSFHDDEAVGNTLTRNMEWVPLIEDGKFSATLSADVEEVADNLGDSPEAQDIIENGGRTYSFFLDLKRRGQIEDGAGGPEGFLLTCQSGDICLANQYTEQAEYEAAAAECDLGGTFVADSYACSGGVICFHSTSTANSWVHTSGNLAGDPAAIQSACEGNGGQYQGTESSYFQ